MVRRIAIIPLLVIASSAAACPREAVVTRDHLPPARDGNIAIQEELEAARRVATIEAYDLFIVRHPDHPLAQIARHEREQIARRRRS